jgi:uncharacterized protein
MTGRERLRGALAGLLSGASGGLFGVGGGVILVPILTGAFRLTQHQAHGTSLAVIGLAAIAGLAIYAVFGNVAWGTALVVALSTLVAAPLGARAAARTKPKALGFAFSIFLVLVALRLLWKTPESSLALFHQGVAAILFDLALGVAVGLLSGYMGVGGGILAVPAFTLVLGMSQQLAQGTSLAVILAAAPAGALTHARHGNVVGKIVPPIALGAALGSPLASWLAQRLPHETLVRCFAVFLLANAFYTWIRMGRAGRAPAPESAASGTS